MHITRLLVEELRAIQRLEIDLKTPAGDARRRTILLGVNGAGKTTVLDAIVHAFSSLAEKQHLGAGSLGASDVRNVDVPSLKAKKAPRRADITVDAVLFEDELRAAHLQPKRLPRVGTLAFPIGELFDMDALLGIDVEPDSEEANLEYVNPKVSFPEPAEFDSIIAAATIATAFRDTARAVIKSLHPACLFLPADRGILEHRDDLTLKQIMALEPCTQSLSRDRSRFAPIAARLALAHGSPQTEEGRSGARMWKVLAKHFPDLPKPVSAEGAMLRFRNKSGAIVPLSALSDGERAILLIFGELALRMPKSCVVLIDEIEQHLHPRWQREILAALLTMAPSAQFILTTQSPYLATCAPDDVVKLPGWDEYGE